MTLNNDTILRKIRNIHFVGIGGSGMCPLAEILHHRGYNITGSDINEGDTLDRIKSLNINVYMGHKAENIKDAQLVVFTAAVKSDNVELVAAKNKGIPLMERSKLLGTISRQYSNTIAVSGTHGKTTVTSMIVQIMLEAGLDISAVIGGKLPMVNKNGIVGSSDIFVCEACEFKDTFLQLSPTTSVILNIDADHLDYFGSLDNIIRSFKKFAKQTSDAIIVNGDDENSLAAVKKLKKEIVTFGIKEHNHWTAVNIEPIQKGCYEFDLCFLRQKVIKITLSAPGKHNIYNALAASAVALRENIDKNTVTKALKNFTGAGRRFEIIGESKGITIVDDYAHHPKELEATLKSAMKMGYGKIWAVFQPFTYSRTALMLDDFAKVLSLADHVVIAEIMGGRETNKYNIYAKDLAAKVDGSVWFESFEEIAEYIVNNAKSGDLVSTLGCGDIYKAAKMIYKRLKEKQ